MVETRIEPLSSRTEGAALEYLGRAPFLNVFLRHLILHDSPGARRDVVVAIGAGGIEGVAYWGRQLVIAADAPALRPLAEHARRRRGERMIVGPRETVRAFWELIRGWHAAPRLVRDRQFVMAIDRKRLQPYESRTTVRHARVEERNEVADGSAAMMRHELGVDPYRSFPDFSAGIRRMIEQKLWWVGVFEGRICFFCHAGPWCERTVQLQGIWTPPALRGRGLATASLAAICDRLLERWPTLSLYVNDFNERAIALYRRVGFYNAGEFQTILF